MTKTERTRETIIANMMHLKSKGDYISLAICCKVAFNMIPKWVLTQEIDVGALDDIYKKYVTEE